MSWLESRFWNQISEPSKIEMVFPVLRAVARELIRHGAESELRIHGCYLALWRPLQEEVGRLMDFTTGSPPRRTINNLRC